MCLTDRCQLGSASHMAVKKSVKRLNTHIVFEIICIYFIVLGLKNQKISFSYYFLNRFHSVYCLVVHYFITDELLFEPYTVPLAYACFSNFIKFADRLVKILVALS